MICPEQSDEALVELTLAGDLQAYEKLVLRHQRNVIASAYPSSRTIMRRRTRLRMLL